MPDKTVGEKIFALFDDLLSVRSIITLGAFYTLYWLVWNAKPIPSIIAHLIDILLGFWFGQKIAKIQAQNKGANNVE